MVLAASIYQVPAIEAARRLGYRVVTTDNVPSNPGHALADASHCVDTTDLPSVLALAKSEKIDGVISPGTDVAVATAAFVADRLGLPGPGLEAAQTLTQKRSFRNFLQRAGLPCPAVAERFEPGEVAGLFENRSWLVKPNRSSGSKGVFVVHSSLELASRIEESESFSLDGSALLEEFIEGTQHTCEGFVRDGELVVALVTDRDTVAPPHTATKGHRVPSLLGAAQRRESIAAVEHVLRLLNIRNGPIDCDFVVNDRGIFLIEVTPRLGGNSLSRLVAAALDFDLVSAAVRAACGDAVAIPAERAPNAAAIVILGAMRAGRVTWNVDQARSLAAEPWVGALLFDIEHGERAEAFINGRHRVGEILITGVDRGDVDAKVNEVARRLDLRAS
jgi:biotin carboxylase